MANRKPTTAKRKPTTPAASAVGSQDCTAKRKPKKAASRAPSSSPRPGTQGRGVGGEGPKSAKRKPPVGRPLGSKNILRDEVDVIGSRCKRCGSSNRRPYQSDPQVLAHAGTDPITHQPYTHVIWRRTACDDCGQARIDKCYEHRL